MSELVFEGDVEYVVIAGDEVVHRTNCREKAVGWAACYGEHVGDACEIAELRAEGGAT